MLSVENLAKEETIDLLNKCWMTHDGMWFSHCLQEFGIEVTNKINKSAIKSLSVLEIDRVKKIIGLDGKIESYNEFRMFFIEASKLMIPEFMNVTFDYPGKNIMTWKFNQGKCFAYLGIKRLGVIEKYECGVLYRIKCWLDSLCINHRFSPEVGLCSMHQTGNCSGQIKLFTQLSGLKISKNHLVL